MSSEISAMLKKARSSSEAAMLSEDRFTIVKGVLEIDAAARKRTIALLKGEYAEELR